MAIYVDATDFYRVRGRSGIQRVVREVVGRMRIDESLEHEIIVLTFDGKIQQYRELPDDVVKKLFAGTLKSRKTDDYPAIEIADFRPGDIFFDIDNGWNTPVKRPALYRRLKGQEVQIYTVAYDMIPLKKPEYADANTLRGYLSYMAAVLTYSDLIFCISRSTERHINELAEYCKIRRPLHTSVINLGCDFGKVTKTKKKPKPEGIEGKYILMVGTVEPRKRQDILLKAFDKLSRKHKDLQLVFVGKAGWGADQTIASIRNHSLFGWRVFWPDDVNDEELNALYDDAHIVAYLSSAEGYGLPIAEGLAKGKVTIGFDNTSQYEAGHNFADYARYETATEVADIIGAYLDNPELHEKKQAYIQANNMVVDWDTAYARFTTIFQELSRAEEIRKREIPKELQFVFISNRLEDIRDTIKQHDMRTPFVKEYIIVTPPKMMKDMESIESTRPIHAVDEVKLLGDRFEQFKKSDHVTKNWMLRSSIPNIARLGDEFVMNDDDNRPLDELPKEFFINKDGTYNAYYFYELPRWVHRSSDYDNAQHISTEYLGRENLELLLYSGHQPHIINKQLFKEAIKLVEDRKMPLPVDEWSTYFNYAISRMPSLFVKKPFETLAWPAHPRSWLFLVQPKRYTIENYYENLYQKGELFAGLEVNGDSEEKKRRAAKREKVYTGSKRQLRKSAALSTKKDMVHGSICYRSKDFDMYVSGLPYIIGAHENTLLRFDINIKIVAKGKKKPGAFRLEGMDRLGRVFAGVGYKIYDFNDGYSELVASLAINAKDASSRYLTFKATIDDAELHSVQSIPKSLLVSVPRKTELEKRIR